MTDPIEPQDYNHYPEHFSAAYNPDAALSALHAEPFPQPGRRRPGAGLIAFALAAAVGFGAGLGQDESAPQPENIKIGTPGEWTESDISAKTICKVGEVARASIVKDTPEEKWPLVKVSVPNSTGAVVGVAFVDANQAESDGAAGSKQYLFGDTDQTFIADPANEKRRAIAMRIGPEATCFVALIGGRHSRDIVTTETRVSSLNRDDARLLPQF